MKIIYTRIAAAAALETGIIANPDYYENPNLKAKEVIAFRIWLEKLGYSVKNLADGKGFTFSFKKEYGLVTCDLAGNALAMQLGEEFEDHLKA